MLFKKKKKYICAVCGYDRLPGPLYTKNGVPDVSLICHCYGFQPGYDDAELGSSLENYRKEWIQNGAEWFREEEKPRDWDLQRQLRNIDFSLN